MIFVKLVALLLFLFVIILFCMYVQIGISIWLELKPMTFEYDEYRGLFYGYFYAGMYSIYVYMPKGDSSIERMTAQAIESYNGTVGARYNLWHYYYNVPTQDRKLKIRSWWALYKDRVV